jgi:hypothetical protein
MTDFELLSALRSDLDSIKGEIASMKVNGDQALSIPGQFAGRGLPARIGAEIDFDGTTRKHQINIIVPPDGPFHASSIAFAFRPTTIGQPDYTRTWMPISSIEDLTLTFPALDFYWEYKVTGSSRERQNIPVPSCMVLRSESGMGYFPLIPQDVFEAVSTIIVYVTPTINMNNLISRPGGNGGVGKLWVGFNGFYSLN